MRNGAYWASATGTTWAELARQVPPLIAEALDAFVAWCSAAAAAPAEFDRIMSSVRYDGGRFSLLAVDAEWRAVAGAPAFWIKVPALEALYYDLPDAEEDEDAFEKAHGELQHKVEAQFRQWLGAPPVSAALAALRRCRRFRISVIDYDDRETERTILELL